MTMNYVKGMAIAGVMLGLISCDDGEARPQQPARLADAMLPPLVSAELAEEWGPEVAQQIAARCLDWDRDGNVVGKRKRPEMRLVDGRMECDRSLEFVPEVEQDPAIGVPQCSGWPYRPPVPTAYTPGGYVPRISCAADLSLCCLGLIEGDLHCEDDWVTCRATESAHRSTTGQSLEVFEPGADCPPAVVEAFRHNLNMCHFLCQHVCTTPE